MAALARSTCKPHREKRHRAAGFPPGGFFSFRPEALVARFSAGELVFWENNKY